MRRVSRTDRVNALCLGRCVCARAPLHIGQAFFAASRVFWGYRAGMMWSSKGSLRTTPLCDSALRNAI
eukprot:362504-Chlamydomonas_euryale.AAC.12